MSSTPEHRAVGAVAAPLATLMLSPPATNNFWLLLAELVGAAAGGAAGGVAPDRLEPATGPYHRGPAHSVAAAGFVGTAGMKLADRAANSLRCDAARIASADPAGALLLHLLAGFARGVPIGYLSHIALDAGTPMSVPLLSR